MQVLDWIANLEFGWGDTEILKNATKVVKNNTEASSKNKQYRNVIASSLEENYQASPELEVIIPFTPKHSSIPKISADAPLNTSTYPLTQQKLAIELSQEVDTPQFQDLEEVFAAIKALDCPLKQLAKNTVTGSGNPRSKIMLIGEGPGEQEDLQGEAFVGASGKLLDKMLASIALDRNKVYITNTVFWRPPNNRVPTSQEVAMCKPFVLAQIRLIQPKLIVLLGQSAIKAFFSNLKGVVSIHGSLLNFEGITVIPTFHPSYLLRAPLQKKLAWQDMLKIRACLAQNKI